MDDMLRNNPVDELTQQAGQAISGMQKSINMPGMPETYYKPKLKDSVQDSFLTVIEGEQKGPYTIAELKALASQGTITPDTLIWKSGMPDWIAIKKYPGII